MDASFVRGSSRLEAYSDAIFAIVATIMIAPIGHTEIPQDAALGHTFVHKLLPRLVVYLFTFLVACNTWAGHVWLFETILKVDELLVMLNLALVMLTTFLPFTFTLLGTFPLTTLAVVIFCGVIMLVGIVQFMCIMHAFNNPEMLELEIRQSRNLKSQRNKMCASALTPVVFGFLAACIAPLSPAAADLILLLVLFGNIFRDLVIRAYVRLHSHVRGQPLTESLDPSEFRDRIEGKTYSKERIECFSDGVFSIVATLIILDICEKDVPSKDDITEHGDLAKALAIYSADFLAYAGTFVTVGLLWHVHHSMLHYLKDFNTVMGLLNGLCLLSVGLTPLMFSVTTQFNRKGLEIEENETIAIQMACTAVFFAGFFQMTIWITALFSQDTMMAPEGRYDGKDHLYITIKLAVYPILSLIIYFCGFASYTIKTDAFNFMQIGAVGLFFLLQLGYLFAKKIYRKREEERRREGNPFDSSLESEDSDRPLADPLDVADVGELPRLQPQGAPEVAYQGI